jgi:hypothetical protein
MWQAACAAELDHGEPSPLELLDLAYGHAEQGRHLRPRQDPLLGRLGPTHTYRIAGFGMNVQVTSELDALTQLTPMEEGVLG